MSFDMECRSIMRGEEPMDETLMNNIPQVSIEENNLLMVVYTEEEVRKTIFQMEHNKAPGHDGFPAEFYQKIGILSKWIFLNCLVVYMLDN
jgi:hypothetical protein